jgi:hypothetical protein
MWRLECCVGHLVRVQACLRLQGLTCLGNGRDCCGGKELKVDDRGHWRSASHIGAMRLRILLSVRLGDRRSLSVDRGRWGT